MDAIVVLGAAAASCSILLVWWAVSGERSSDVARNLMAGLGPVTDLRQAILDRSASERAVGPAVRALAARARRLTPAGLVDALERRIFLAGRPSGWPLERVLAIKLLAGGAGAVAGVLRVVVAPGVGSILIAAGLAAVGYFLPDFLLYSKGGERQKLIRQELPDTLDQITISVEAGLGFEAAMARAARSRSGPFAAELSRTLQDIQAGLSRSQALRAIVDRTDVPELRHFVAAVLQAESYGIPIGQVLRIQAAELRVKRRQRAEERALKLPVKVIFPLIFCIFPAIFIVILGPGIISLSNSFLFGG
jgi:tight adherence protein C